jgi:hypothetical protein
LLSFLDSSESRRSKASFKKEIKPESGEAEKDFSAEEDVSTMWREAFMKAYKAMDKELKSHANLDCFCSGSTSVTVVKQVPQRSASIIFLILFLVVRLQYLSINRAQDLESTNWI